ncbi:hypothetical protein V8C42DRAFT_114842 [Trichoderma barbatum]
MLALVRQLSVQLSAASLCVSLSSCSYPIILPTSHSSLLSLFSSLARSPLPSSLALSRRPRRDSPDGPLAPLPPLICSDPCSSREKNIPVQGPAAGTIHALWADAIGPSSGVCSMQHAPDMRPGPLSEFQALCGDSENSTATLLSLHFWTDLWRALPWGLWNRNPDAWQLLLAVASESQLAISRAISALLYRAADLWRFAGYEAVQLPASSSMHMYVRTPHVCLGGLTARVHEAIQTPMIAPWLAQAGLEMVVRQ